jgi:RNA methyltransferase, RsmE family
MELFYSKNIAAGETCLDAEESNHCARVLRHRSGDEIHVIDGVSNLYRCRIVDDSPKCVSFEILERIEGWGSHPYHLHMAVAPPKNIDRFEWFAEKATEIGLDEITPLFGEYSERKVFKGERVSRILVSAAKQSHKSAVPVLHEAVTVKDFLSAQPSEAVRLICYCDETDSLDASKIDIKEALRSASADKDIIIMIGPEGDFSRTEIQTAISLGWQPVSLGESRLRIETAALVATAAVYIDKI